MKVINLGENNSVLNTFVAEIRDIKVQKDSLRFRNNLERIGSVFGYEISKLLKYSAKDVVTPLGIAKVSTPDDKLVLATILRSGLPLHRGLLHFFDHAESAFVSAYRKYDRGDDFHINVEYCTCPSISGKTLILADPMLATGASLAVTYGRLCDEGGQPEHTHFVCPVASVYAVEYLQREMPSNTTLWTAAIDEELTSQSYIVPGLGDAGDLAYGDKI